MQTVPWEASAHPKRVGASAIRDLPATGSFGKTRVVIRLPELTVGNRPAPTAPDAGPLDVPQPPMCDDPWQIEEKNTEPAIEFAISSHLAAESASVTEAPAMITAPSLPKPAETVASIQSVARAPSPGLFSICWNLIGRGHAFLMQPKVWLACVLSCSGLIITVFYLQPKAVQDSEPQAVQARETKPEPATGPATQIVAPPAEMSPNDAAAHGLDMHTTAGFVPPLGDASLSAPRSGEQSAMSGKPDDETIRMAADPRLGADSARYDGQISTDATAATISEVAPLDVPEDINPQGGTLR
jgi:hypothetical protein